MLVFDLIRGERLAGSHSSPASPERPAWNFKVPSAAVIVPSFFTPILTCIDDPEVGPVALKTSSRLIVTLTGRPVFFDKSAATGSI